MSLPARAVLVASLGLLAAAAPLPRDPMVEADEGALREEGLASTGTALLAHVRSRTLTPASRDRIDGLIRGLGADSFEEREKASAALLKEGPAALPQLRAASSATDLELRLRARRCLGHLEADRKPAVMAAALRMLAVRRPPGACAAVLAFLPDADELEAEAAREALARITSTSAKPDPAVVAALADPQPLRRAAAAEVLAARTEHRAAVRKLLNDRQPLVRLAAARGLALAGERSPVPVLIDLLPDLPPVEATALQERLLRLAGEKPPELTFRDGAAERKKDRDAWVAWWAKNGPKADLRLLAEPAELGRTLMITFTGTKTSVFEKGRDGRTLWAIEGLHGGADAHVLPGNRVLIAELWAGKVTERTFDGKVVWEHKVGSPGSVHTLPVRCQRLRNGNTFIVTMSGYLEVDPGGREVFRRDGLSLREGWKYPDGRIALLLGNGEYQRLDPSGKVEKRFRAPVSVGDGLAGVEFLAGGGVLVARDGQLIEYSPEGKEVWRAAADQPYGLTRLANGNTLVACRATKEFAELDRGGRVVRKMRVDEIPWRGRRR